MKNLKIRLLILATAMLWGLSVTGTAQTSAFTYQGRFTDSAVAQPTSGTYNMQFTMFDAAANGNQVGVTVTVPAVQVVNGIFTVTLDYTAAGFDGAPRFLQVTVGNTVLSPRQEITSAPFAIAARKALVANKAIDSDKLGGIDADQYVTGQVVRSVNNLTNNVTLAAGSNITITPSGNTLTIAATGGAGGGSGINNQTTLQTAANFNIDGTGAAKIFNATTQFNIGGNRFLSGGSGNVFAGDSAGAATTGGDNAFVGTRAGLTNTTGFNNSFFGTDAGRTNTANDNSFFGRSAGYDNSTGTKNAFFAEDAGRFNTTGSQNSFFGYSAGRADTIGNQNSFFGSLAGLSNTTGFSNSFFGRAAGAGNVDGADNSFFGHGAGELMTTGNNNSFFGSDAGRNNAADYNSFFGRSAGFDNTTGTRNVFVGVDAGRFNQTGGKNSFFGTSAGNNNLTGANNTVIGDSANVGANNLNFATALGSGATVSTSNTVVLGRTADTVVAPNLLQVGTLGANGSTALCRNAANQISSCAAGGGTNSGDYIQNQQSVVQSADFNIGGSGRVGGFLSGAVVSTETFYRIGTQIILSTPNQTSVAVGQSTGFNATGGNNSFFGAESGKSNTSGARNSYFGFQSGQTGKTNNDNTFFGYQAGAASTVGGNTFVGSQAGASNTTGTGNTSVGFNSSGEGGNDNTAVGSSAFGSGTDNAALGSSAVAIGSNNISIGSSSRTRGNGNTVIGNFAKADNGSGTQLSNATAIGAGAVADSDNTVVLGRSADEVKIPGVLRVSGSAFTQSLKTSLLTVTGGDIKFTTVNFPTNTGNRHLCLNANSFVAVCPEDVGNSPTFDKNQPEQKTQIEAQAAQIKAQAALIERQAEQFKQQQAQIEALKQIVCSMNPAAAICTVK